MKCQIPYGSGALELVLPDEKVAGVLESSVAPSQGNEDELVLEAMANPYGGKSLKELAVGKKTCAIIISDHTRPVPSKHIIPFMLAELREGNPDIEIWVVEPENAAILAGGTIGTHMQMGIGDGIIPDILNREIYDEICVTTDTEAIETSKRLAREEGLMVGISSGTNVAAALKLAAKLGEGKTVVTVLPDTAERYFSTPLFGE